MLPGNTLFAGDLDDSRCKALKAVLGNLWLLHSAMDTSDRQLIVVRLGGWAPAFQPKQDRLHWRENRARGS